VASHTDKAYEKQLEELRERLLRMAGRTEQMIANSVRALITRDEALARATVDADHSVNRMEVETDELCLVILAKRQPLASDLRFITLALKMVTDLERIGDLAVNICERAIDLSRSTQPVALPDISPMAVIVQSMVHDAIEAFIAADADRAEAVILRDDQVDREYTRVFRQVLEQMTQDPTRIAEGIHIQSVVKWLERMGDHATNLAELVVFMVRGKDIRHIGKLDA
jgi:phosphate transport system protein